MKSLVLLLPCNDHAPQRLGSLPPFQQYMCSLYCVYAAPLDAVGRGSQASTNGSFSATWNTLGSSRSDGGSD
eukprot:3577160-Prymnesium_polylepis.1